MRILIIYLLCPLVTVYSVDYYELLGISKDADNREIRRAFKKLALKLHPDKNMEEENAHEQFIAINKAYEVLKDEETRKKYDLYGEEGLKEDFGNSWRGNYRSWNYYYESFGIYDDDPEIITLNKNDFVQSVLESNDLWFINFYSPQCSHCHHLAPVWRELARNFEGVLQIGAVNCEEDWMLCRQQNIQSYPSLVLYPLKEKYQGSRDLTSMMDYVLQHLPDNVIKLTSHYFSEIVMEETASQPWLIVTCKNTKGCLDSDEIKKLGAILKHLVNVAEVEKNSDEIKKLGVILKHLVNVAEVEKNTDEKICEFINCHVPVSFYFDLNAKNIEKNLSLPEVEVSEIVKTVLAKLPEPENYSEESFKAIITTMKKLTSSPRLIHFSNNMKSSESNIDLKRLKALLPEVVLGNFDCGKYPSTCAELYLQKFPTFLLFKPNGAYEFHYGRITAYDVARFVREALLSQVHTLTPSDFPRVVESGQSWFIDFFAPWCPPCMQFLPQWRKASQSSGHLVKFGTVDCSIHVNLCRKYNINSYPTAILYNMSKPHKFYGSHSQHHVDEFVEDILHPSVVSLSSSSFENLVQSKSHDEIWVVDFFAPWCGPCQQLSPQWRKLAKLLSHIPSVHIGEVDCQAHYSLCSSMGINSYPTILLYPSGQTGTSRFFSYNGWNRDALSIQAWIYNFLPSKVNTLTTLSYKEALADGSPWLIDYYAPWCSHCHSFAPEFEKIAQSVEGKVKTGKVNCEEFPRLCQLASVRAYPTVKFYRGKKGDHPQDPTGVEIHTLTFNGILSFLEDTLIEEFQGPRTRDEL